MAVREKKRSIKEAKGRPLEHVELSTHAPRNCRRLQKLYDVIKVVIICLNFINVEVVEKNQPFSRAAKRSFRSAAPMEARRVRSAAHSHYDYCRASNSVFDY